MNTIHLSYTRLSIIVAAALIGEGYLLASPLARAEGEALLGASGEVGCTLSAEAVAGHTAIISPGQTKSGIGTTSIKAYCNDTSGYSLYVKAADSSSLTSSTNPALSIPTGLATSGDTSSWAMKLTPSGTSYVPTLGDYFLATTDTDGYSLVPEDYEEAANFSDSTDSTIGSVTNVTYRAYISPTQTPGTYSGSLIFRLVHPKGAPAEGPADITGLTYMQDITPKICAGTREGISTQLIDSRDDKLYWVTKFADGNCWMTQNLDYDLDANVALTTADSDVSGDWTPLRSTIHGTSLSSSTWTNDNSTTYSWDPGDYQITDNSLYAGGCRSNDFSTCTSYGVTSASSLTSGANHYHVGNYYNWPAAIASNDSSSYETAYETVPTSICPKGWKLPNGMTDSNTASMYSKLFTDSGIEIPSIQVTKSSSSDIPTVQLIFQDPFYLIRGDRVDNGSVYAGTSGYYWSSSVSSGGYYPFSLAFTREAYVGDRVDRFDPQGNFNYRYYGYFVRCVARKAMTRPTITYDANGGSGAPGPTQAISALDISQTLTLSSTVPTKSGLVFVSWNTKSDGSGTSYVPGSTITTSDDVTLYAVWAQAKSFDEAFAEAGKAKQNGYYKMQDMDGSICDAVQPYTIGLSTQLIDIRDNKLYWVTKLADGNCWMTQNLDLDLSTSKTLTSADTNLPEGSTWTPDKNTGECKIKCVSSERGLTHFIFV